MSKEYKTVRIKIKPDENGFYITAKMEKSPFSNDKISYHSKGLEDIPALAMMGFNKLQEQRKERKAKKAMRDAGKASKDNKNSKKGTQV